MKKFITIIIVIVNTSILFAVTLTFINGHSISGNLISIEKVDSFNKKKVFDDDKWSRRSVTKKYRFLEVDNSLDFKTDKYTITFSEKSVYKIINTKGKVFFMNNSEIKDSSGQILVSLLLIT